MPKSIAILPEEQRKKGTIKLKPIPLNQYDRTMKDELQRYSREDLVRIYRDMYVIRTFETMLQLSLIHISEPTRPY